MKIKRLHIENFKSISNLRIDLNDINILIGPNNSGKSSILKALAHLQGSTINSEDIRASEQRLTVTTFYDHDLYYYPKDQNPKKNYKINSGNIFPCIVYNLGIGSSNLFLREYVENNYNLHGNYNEELSFYPNVEPKNLIVPFNSKRKVGNFSEEVNSKIVNEVAGNFYNLNSKVDRILSLDNEVGSEFKSLIAIILNFNLKTYQSQNGKKIGLNLNVYDNIPLESLGDGVSQIVGFLNELCLAKDKIFLIEEPETEIHPKALKHLLNIIINKSKTNQFFIATHSHIVLNHLGSADNCNLFETQIDYKIGIPTTSITKINSLEERLITLRNLGYELFDYHLWDSWIIFEESSAERLVRDFFIPWYCKKLMGRVRTISANSKDNVVASFDDFNRIFCYLHLEKNYFDRAFVIVDNNANDIITKLREKFPTWDPKNFICLSEDDFENFYPAEFQEDVKKILSSTDRKKKREGKRKLLEKVLDWISKDQRIAQAEFKKTAKAVIDHLKDIENKLYPN